MTIDGTLTDRVARVLLASAAGDALGAGYEFTYPAAETPIDMIGGGPFGFEPGEWTDDTSMTVAVARVTAQGSTCVLRRDWTELQPVSASGSQMTRRTSGTRPGPCCRRGTRRVPRCSQLRGG